MQYFTDYYALLKISLVATNTEIRAAYLQQCKQWHPDKNPGTDTTKIMQSINEARMVLLDPGQRALYDLQYQVFKQYGRCQFNSDPFEQKKQYQQQQSRYNRQRYAKLKKRVAVYKAGEPYLHKTFMDRIIHAGDKELTDICFSWNEYAVAFIDLIVIELHEKRNYDINEVFSFMKEKPVRPHKEADKVDWEIVLFRLIIFAILSSMLRVGCN